MTRENNETGSIKFLVRVAGFFLLIYQFKKISFSNTTFAHSENLSPSLPITHDIHTTHAMLIVQRVLLFMTLALV